MTCAKCNRYINPQDVDARGLCVFCAPMTPADHEVSAPAPPFVVTATVIPVEGE